MYEKTLSSFSLFVHVCVCVFVDVWRCVCHTVCEKQLSTDKIEGKTFRQVTPCQGQMFVDVTKLVYTDFVIFVQLRKCCLCKMKHSLLLSLLLNLEADFLLFLHILFFPGFSFWLTRWSIIHYPQSQLFLPNFLQWHLYKTSRGGGPLIPRLEMTGFWPPHKHYVLRSQSLISICCLFLKKSDSLS